MRFTWCHHEESSLAQFCNITSHHVLRHKISSSHSCLWSLLRSISSPSCSLEKLKLCTPKVTFSYSLIKHPQSLSPLSVQEMFIFFPVGALFTPFHHFLLLQSSSPLARDTTDTLQAYDMLFTIPLMGGEPVVCLLFPMAPSRAMWLFPACTIWCHFCAQTHFGLPRFSV